MEVTCSVRLRAEPDHIWMRLREFGSPWHPWIETMTRTGAERVFSVIDDPSVYRERLTYFSDWERTYRYTHVAGIEGVSRYDAELRVEADGQVVMSAELEADQPRDQDIADGTRAVFEAGLNALSQQHFASVKQRPVTKEQVILQNTEIAGSPRLTISMAGKQSQTAVLFLHGIGGNRRNWDQQMRALAPSCRVAALDLRGYGQSDLGPEHSTIDDYCADILRVQKAIGAKRLILCGLSYGAWIATSFAMRFPETLAALIVSGGCTGMSEAGVAERNAFRKARLDPLDEGKSPKDFAPAIVDVISGPDTSGAVRMALQRSMEAITPDTYRDALMCFTNPTETFDFSRLNMPVILMTGEHDVLAPPSEIRGVAQRIFEACEIPDVRFEVIPNAGHVCNLERPDYYTNVLRDVLARLE